MRLRGKSLIKLAIKEQFKYDVEGNMLMDLPEGLSYTDIENLSQNHKLWKQLSIILGDTKLMLECINEINFQPTPDPTSPVQVTEATASSTTTTTNGNHGHERANNVTNLTPVASNSASAVTQALRQERHLPEGRAPVQSQPSRAEAFPFSSAFPCPVGTHSKRL